MRKIQSMISTSSAEFRRNEAHNRALAGAFREKQEAARHARPQRDLDRLQSQGKMRPRERIEKLLDPGTPFLELSSLAANMAYGGESPSASSIVGIGVVSGREVMIRADDPTVKAALVSADAKKIVRALDRHGEPAAGRPSLRFSRRLPAAAVGNLPGQIHGRPDFPQPVDPVELGVKQLALVFGHCTAGGAYIPGLSDYNVIVRGTGAVFLGGPPLVRAATGEDVTVEELGGADMHTSISGTCDYPAANEDEAIHIGREIVAQWEMPKKWDCQREASEDPAYDPQEIYGILPDDIKKQFDMREIIARIVDGSRFHEYQPNYGTTLIAGFANIWGFKVGILANNGVLFNDSSLKGAHFIELCNQNNTPLVFLQNITGYMIGREYERKGITKDGAKMIMAQSCSHVPKFTVMCNGSFGAGNYGMCGRAFDGRLLFTWPNHQIGVMGGDQAANTLAEVKVNQMKRNSGTVDQAEIDRLWDDTRKALSGAAVRLLFDFRDLGRRHHRPGRHAQRARHRHFGLAQRAAGNAGYGVFRF